MNERMDLVGLAFTESLWLPPINRWSDG